MTTYSKRRGRRSLAAVLAALLMASLLAVVAGSPAGAANTASEKLQDHDQKASTPKVREFGGTDRYDTAIRLAKNWATLEGGIGSVTNVFVASGTSLVDAVSVAGLAGAMNAPVLLTESDELPGSVKDFIEDYGVDNVYLLGGSAAISDAVATSIEGLTNEPTVTRIAGADRYATAAAISAKITDAASWCGGDGSAAVLVNGEDGLVNAVAVGPMAYRLRVPILLTATDELPEATLSYIDDADIEHVVVIGETSSDITAALTAAGVDQVEPIEGDSPAAVSANLANLAAGDCRTHLGAVSMDTVALIRGDKLVDGVAAAPVLADSADNGDLVPVLVVGESLPSSVADYLAATSATTTAGKLHLEILAIGGYAAVSDSVMQAAIKAAASADALTVSITAGQDDPKTPTVNEEVNGPLWQGQTGEAANQIKLRFSDTVQDNAAKIEGLIRDILMVNGAPASLAATTPVTRSASVCGANVVTVTLASALKAGDVVSVASGTKVGSVSASGTADDLRPLVGDSKTVRAAIKDGTRPTVSVVGIVGENSWLVRFSEAVTGEFGADDVKLYPAGNARSTVKASAPTEVSNLDGAYTVANSDGNPIAKGDRLSVLEGAVMDASGNKSRRSSPIQVVAKAAGENPKITAARMSPLVHTEQSAAIFSADITDLTTGTNGLKITAKKGGTADGAYGNGWRIVADVLSSHDPDKPLDIDVAVDPKGRQVSVRFVNGKPKVSDLIKALNDESEFASRFTAELEATTTDCAAALRTELSLRTTGEPPAVRRQVTTTMGGTGDGHVNGSTVFAIEVTFSTEVKTIGHGALLRDILKGVSDRTKGSQTVDDTFWTTLRDNLGLASANVDSDLDVFQAPSRMVRYEAKTTMANHLPMSTGKRDTVVTDAGTNETGAWVAEGYATDADTTDDKFPNRNAKSSVLLIQSASVKAR